MDKFQEAVLRIRTEQFFEEKRASAKVSTVQLIGLMHAGSAEDPELLKLAAFCRPKAPLAFYEELGGTFKEAGVLSRSKELLTGSKVKALESAATKHMSKAVHHAGDAVQPKLVAKLLERTHDFNTPLGRAAHKHVTEKAFKASASAAREGKAMGKIHNLADKEDTKVFATRAGLSLGAYGGAVAGAAKLRQRKKDSEK